MSISLYQIKYEIHKIYLHNICKKSINWEEFIIIYKYYKVCHKLVGAVTHHKNVSISWLNWLLWQKCKI